MSIHVALNHVTHYRYDRPIHLGPQVVRLRPAPHSRTRILSYSMKVEPAEALHQLAAGPAGELPRAPRLSRTRRRSFASRSTWSPRWRSSTRSTSSSSRAPSTFRSPTSPSCSSSSRPTCARRRRRRSSPRTWPRVDRSEKATSSFLVELNQGLQKDIAYLIRMEHGVQTPELTLHNASGSCRDSAWLLVQLLRHLGLAARFVSGYLIQLKSDVKSLDGPSGTEVDFTDLHAWCEVYLPGAGWIGLDPTSGLLRRRGPHPARLLARAVVGGADQRPCSIRARRPSSTTCRCARVWEAPRVTLPYSELQWGAIDALGKQVDADLRRLRRAPHARRRADLRLGRRPRRRRMEHRGDGADQARPERRADGAAAREVRRRRPRPLRPGQVVSGRAAAALVAQPLLAQGRRADLARPRAVRRASATTTARPRRRRASSCTAWRFASASTGATSSPAYEDVGYYLWREGKLPINVDPLDSRLADKAERDRLRRVFERGLGAAVGYALPIARRRARHAEALALDALVPARRPLLPRRRRFAARLSPAARFAAVGARRRHAVGLSARRQRRFAAAPR